MSSQIQETKTDGRVILRKVANASATVGIFTNIAALNVIGCDAEGWEHNKGVLGWAFLPLFTTLTMNIIHLRSKNASKRSPYLLAFGDMSMVLLFLGVLVPNGIEATKLQDAQKDVSKIMLLAYNSMPWIMSGAMHLALMIYPVLAKLANINFEKRLPKMSCGRKIQLVDGDVKYNDDVEAQPEKGQGHQVTVKETEPLLD